jgi:hypothetical protein
MEYNLDKFNSLIEQASQAINCGKECQEEKRTNELREKYERAQFNKLNAGHIERIAEKAYITYTQGEEGYDEYITKDLTKDANEITQNIRTFFRNNFRELVQKLNNYDDLNANYSNIEELHEKYNDENSELFKDLKNTSSDVITNNRKTYYEDQSIQTLKNIYYVLLFIYIIGVIVFVASLFFYPTNRTIGQNIIIFLIMVIYPFISLYIFQMLYQLYNFIISLLPKNVYKNL